MTVLAWLKEKSSQRHQHNCTPHRGKRFVVLCVLTDFHLRHEQCKLVRVCVAVDSLLCKSLVVALDTDLKDPYPLDRAEVMAYLRDVVRQSNESERSEVRQHEPGYKKDS